MRRVLIAVAAALLSCSARGAPFADPTQPPTVRSGEYRPAAGPRLESILIAPDRRVAVIDGLQVSVGGRVGSNTVLRITESGVVMSGADGEWTLRLFPELGRNAVSPAKKGTSK